MPIEIKELVIRTILENGKNSSEENVPDIEAEVKRQLKKYRAEIVSQCLEAVNEGLKRQGER